MAGRTRERTETSEVKEEEGEEEETPLRPSVGPPEPTVAAAGSRTVREE